MCACVCVPVCLPLNQITLSDIKLLCDYFHGYKNVADSVGIICLDNGKLTGNVAIANAIY